MKTKKRSTCSRKFVAFTKSAVTGQKLKEQIMHIKELCKHMAMETTISDLMGNCSPTCIVMPVQMKIERLKIK